MNVASNYKRWRTNEVRFLRQNYGPMTSAQIGAILGRTPWSVQKYARDHGIPRLVAEAMPLNDTQLAVLRFIHDRSAATGLAPYLADIASGLGLKNKNVARERVMGLVRKGWVAVEKWTPRGITVLAMPLRQGQA